MPRFWVQRHTILPFPVHNPRIVTLSFLSEALQLPGYLYAPLNKIPEAATLVAGLLCLWTIFSLTRRIGAGVEASLCATAVSLGYTNFALSIFQSGAEMVLTGALFGGSILFLVDLRENRTSKTFPLAEVGCSIFLFVMACGAKNSTIALSPVYFVLLAIASSRAGLSRRAISARMAGAVMVAGLGGLLCSGVAWNYASNKLWLGKRGLPTLIQSTVARDYKPRQIWTRLCRGGVLLAFDTIWVPKSIRPKYAKISESTLKLLGGHASLPEDDDYYSFRPEPQRGLGILGIAFFIPALILGSSRSLSLLRHGPTALSPHAFTILALALLAIAAFVVCHVLLRWPTIGLLRLMFPFLIAGAPLTALLFERKWLRIPALALLMISAGMFSVFWMGNAGRRMGWTEKPFFQKLARLQNPHTLPVRYSWKGQSAREFIAKEDFSMREIHSTFLAGIASPATIGFIGNGNSECYYLFGPHAENRIVPLVDTRDEDNIMDVPSVSLDYVVADSKFAQAREWAQANGFEEAFTSSTEKGEYVVAFKNKSRSVDSNRARNRQQALTKWWAQDF
jgi:hypothetical protein